MVADLPHAADSAVFAVFFGTLNLHGTTTPAAVSGYPVGSIADHLGLDDITSEFLGGPGSCVEIFLRRPRSRRRR